MLKFTGRTIAVALWLAVVGTANASVVPAVDDVNRMALSANYAPAQRSAARSTVERTSTIDANAAPSGLPQDANPYAMLAAGLAIMGVMARRRWRNQL